MRRSIRASQGARRRVVESGGGPSLADAAQDIVDMMNGGGNCRFFDISSNGASLMFEERWDSNATKPGTTTQSSVDGVVGTIEDSNGDEPSYVQTNDSYRGILRDDSGVYSIECDGIDDLPCRTINIDAPKSDMCVFLGIYTDDTQFIWAAPTLTAYAGASQDGSSSTLQDNGIGTPDYYIDNVQHSGSTRDDLHFDIPQNTRTLLEVRGMDLTSFSLLNVLSFQSGAWHFDGKLGPVMIMPETLRAGTGNMQKILDYYEAAGWYTP